MKRFIKVFSLIVLFVGAFFLFSSEARANFAESFTEVVDSLRGVEEEAVKIFMPQPQSVDEIVLGNRESEALTAEGVLFESSLSPISYLGNCDDNSIGLKIENMELNFGSIDLMNGIQIPVNYKILLYQEKIMTLINLIGLLIIQDLIIQIRYIDIREQS